MIGEGVRDTGKNVFNLKYIQYLRNGGSKAFRMSPNWGQVVNS